MTASRRGHLRAGAGWEGGPRREAESRAGIPQEVALIWKMARKQKPPGMENWTWEEIRMGQKMSRGQKKARRLVKSLGGQPDEDGILRIPEGGGRVLAALLLVMMLAVAIFFPKGCAN